MNDIFEPERKFPGCRIPYGRSDWLELPWEDCLLRVRTIYDGKSAQLSGYVFVELAAGGETVLGLLPPDFHPTRLVKFIVPIDSGSSLGWAELEIASDGWVVLRSRIPMSTTTFRRVYPLDGLSLPGSELSSLEPS